MNRPAGWKLQADEADTVGSGPSERSLKPDRGTAAERGSAPGQHIAPGELPFVFTLLTSVFAAGLTISAVLATKVIAVGPFSVPAGVLAFSLTFLCTDVANELCGPRTAYRIVASGFAALVVVLVLIELAIIWPSAEVWAHQEAFEIVMVQSGRVIVASLTAYIVSQWLDVWLFARIRNATGARFLWLRNNASTALAQLVDSGVFVTVAFLGILPVAPLILGQWVVKLVIAALDTPLVYLAVYRSRQTLRRRGPDVPPGENRRQSGSRAGEGAPPEF